MNLRDEPARQTSAAYPLRFRQRVLFGDVDAYRHMNNGAIARLFEEGRAEINGRIFSAPSVLSLQGHQLMLARLTSEFLAQGAYPGEIEVCTGIWASGNSSFTHAQAAFQDGACIAIAEAVMVKAVSNRPTPLSEAERAVILELRVSH